MENRGAPSNEEKRRGVRQQIYNADHYLSDHRQEIVSGNTAEVDHVLGDHELLAREVGGVQHTREHQLDSRSFASATGVIARGVDRIRLGTMDHSDTIVRNLRERFHAPDSLAIDWRVVGTLFCRNAWRGIPRIMSMNAAYHRQPKMRMPRRPRRQREIGDATQPESQSGANRAAGPQHIDPVHRATTELRAAYVRLKDQSRPFVPLHRLIVDPTSFGRTVHRLFSSSIVVAVGRAYLHSEGDNIEIAVPDPKKRKAEPGAAADEEALVRRGATRHVMHRFGWDDFRRARGENV